ncbi:MAG: serine/threonine-protein kinase [Pyrinomonadaceae bacterium]
MIEPDHYIGQVLDEKYRLERLLGRGGMGAVYLATHLGTDRYVALKLITPQFMRNEEFVARFKREARAAGRLRHPNVVDVTDFGFAQASGEPVAYLVMEYLDGCTLGDVLTEEKRLPLEWVVDILEQVCSAVHEAHQQGIVHRDLKPDNIWLEPNRLGGYRVKVLDFGIAKLAEVNTPINDSAELSAAAVTTPTSKSTAVFNQQNVTQDFTKAGSTPTRSDSVQGEMDTLLYSAGRRDEALTQHSDYNLTHAAQPSEDQTTKLFARPASMTNITATEVPEPESPDDGDNTILLDGATRRDARGKQTVLRANRVPGSQLTRVGAIMGTPLYMSPEQCAARSLDSRSDIYSLGVIAYQMLSGEPPFAGETGSVMREHMNLPPPPLREKSKKVPRRAADVVMAALSKRPEDRPPTAAAFASALRAQADGIGSLYRRAFALYSEYFPKFLRLSFIAHLPVIVITLLIIALGLAENSLTHRGLALKIIFIVCLILLVLLQVAAYFVAASVISGMTAVIVTQLTAAPLRPVELRTGFAVLRRRWRPLLKTSLLLTLRLIVGFCALIIPGLIIYVRYLLFAPVVLIEGLEKKAARLRARQLASRSWRTVIIVSLLQFVIPITVSILLGHLSIGVHQTEGSGKHGVTVSREIYQQVSGLFNIFIVPLMSIVPALLYLKMRQLGGETLAEALAQIEEVDTKQSGWQQRMRTRLNVYTPHSPTPGR